MKFNNTPKKLAIWDEREEGRYIAAGLLNGDEEANTESGQHVNTTKQTPHADKETVVSRVVASAK